jgi:AbrB family looped-hinge helix DNA binding protein
VSPSSARPSNRGEEPTEAATATAGPRSQVTLPKAVLDVLGIEEGDQIVFRVDGDRAVLTKTPHLLTLAGAIPVPISRRSATWDDVLAAT